VTAKNKIFQAVMPHSSKEILENWQSSTKLHSIITQKIVLFFNVASTYHRESSVLGNRAQYMNTGYTTSIQLIMKSLI
jgi:hypothetical protein